MDRPAGRGNRLEPSIAPHPSYGHARRCSDCDRRLRGLARGRDQPVERKRAGFKRPKRAALQDRLRLHQRRPHHRSLHRIVRLQPARRGAATRRATAGRTHGGVHANPAGPARANACRKAESSARHRNRDKPAGSARQRNCGNTTSSACTRHRSSRTTASRHHRPRLKPIRPRPTASPATDRRPIYTRRCLDPGAATVSKCEQLE